MKPLFVIIFSGFLLSLSCKSPSYTLDDFQGRRLIFGQGGGFTGQEIEYVIFENGQVFRKNSLNRAVEEKNRLDKNMADQIFSNYDVMDLQSLRYHQPSNMYYYIVDQQGEETHKILWNNEQSSETQKKLKLFYLTVMQRIKK